jgi:MoaA/NifB/PqqE/SkfB family radical SAM enzyme
LVDGHTPAQIFNAALARVNLGVIAIYQPVELIFNVTDRCTLQCQMCMNHAPTSLVESTAGYHIPCEDLSFDLYKHVMEKYPKAMNVCLAGIGEPLVNSEIFKMVSFAKQKKKRVSIVSNGTLLSSALDEMVKYSPDFISISLITAQEDDFEATCNVSKSTFNRIIEGIRGLIEVRNRMALPMNIGLSCVLKKSRLAIVEPMIELAASLGVDSIDFHNLIPSTLPGCDIGECLFAEDQSATETFSQIPIPPGLAVRFPKLLKREIDVQKCRSFNRVLYVDGRGSISGCYRVFPPDAANGSVFERAVWNNDYFKTQRRRFKRGKVPDTCRYCVDLS